MVAVRVNHTGFRPVFLLILCLLPCFLPPLAAASEGVPSTGFPYVQNFTKHTYQAGNQNWSVTQGPDGVMYYGNSIGLLAYDGNHWQLYPMPHNLTVRAVAADNKGRIYTGAFGEIGYWGYNSKGRFLYTSLTDLVPPEFALKDEVWKIYTDGDRVLFQSFASIFIYENGRMEVVRAEAPFLFLLKAGDRYFVEVISKGLYELKNKKLELIAPAGAPGASGVLSVLPFRMGTFLIGTNRDGLFLYDGHFLKPWQNQANTFLKENQLNNGVRLQNGRFAYGTILKGVVVVDTAGNVVQKIDKSSGLQNNTVLSLYADPMQNLWLGLDNGIDHIEIDSPLYFYFDKGGRFGTVYASIIHDNKIYLGTNQGLFYSAWTPDGVSLFQNLDFRMIPGSQGQVWDLSLIDGQLLCGHNDGTFRVEGDKLVKVSDAKGGWVIGKLLSDPDYLLQGTYNGLVLYKKDGSGNWALWHRVEGFSGPSRYVEQDNSGNIWVSHAYKGLFRLTLSNDLRRVKESSNYGKASGLPTDYKINISRLFNRLLFSSGAGFYVFDEVSNRFSPYQELNTKLGSFASSNRILPADKDTYWFINHGKVALVDFGSGGELTINTNQFRILDGRMVQEYENISRIRASDYLISIDDGFVVYSSGTRQPQPDLPPVLIRRIENTTDGATAISDRGSSGVLLELPFDRNNIRFAYSLPLFHQANVRFQYLLEGYSSQWSAWGGAAQKEFSNLPHGEYTFKVRARVDGSQLAEAAIYTFTVLPPWYATTWAFLAYAVLATLLALLLRKLYYLKLQRDKARIEQKLEQEKQEHLKREALLHEQKLVKLRNEQLRSELSGKSRELASTALNIVYKNELLQNIRVEMHKLEDADGNRLPAARLRKIQKIIDEGMGDRHDWNRFENSFDEAHENYFKKLKEGYPELTPNDLKLSAYLRMNMSSKEIASLLNITVRSVELRRYRLRKKLNMEHDKNLVEFFMGL
ncbi:triple tyrosine motif-containing protein [Pontibacter russatus]|uniref:triple tyrosine motif-containing protein n=1 Tax=Pontibacter russatus TaxID=2694929 RepID=UPI00137B064C|nr:triple tyrosine motif-containing protein [Pontibacter russatus]